MYHLYTHFLWAPPRLKTMSFYVYEFSTLFGTIDLSFNSTGVLEGSWLFFMPKWGSFGSQWTDIESSLFKPPHWLQPNLPNMESIVCKITNSQPKLWLNWRISLLTFMSRRKKKIYSCVTLINRLCICIQGNPCCVFEPKYLGRIFDVPIWKLHFKNELILDRVTLDIIN